MKPIKYEAQIGYYLCKIFGKGLKIFFCNSVGGINDP